MRENEVKYVKTQLRSCSRHDFCEQGFVCVGGVCPYCLHERLSSLCPECAHDLPCSCTPRFSACGGDEVGSVGRVANLIKCEPAFSRSTVPYFYSVKSERVSETGSDLQHWFLKLFKGNKGYTKSKDALVMNKSKSEAGAMLFSPATVKNKGNGWYFPSPIKVFRQSRVSKMFFQQRSPPVYRA